MEVSIVLLINSIALFVGYVIGKKKGYQMVIPKVSMMVQKNIKLRCIEMLNNIDFFAEKLLWILDRITVTLTY